MSDIGDRAQQDPAWAEHPRALAKDNGRVVDVLEHAGGHDGIEGGRPEWQLAPAWDELHPGDSTSGITISRTAQHLSRDVARRHPHSGSSRATGDLAGAAAKIEHAACGRHTTVEAGGKTGQAAGEAAAWSVFRRPFRGLGVE
jgi:hypothetical protein